MSTLISSLYKCSIEFVKALNSRYNCGICLHVADEPLNCGNKDGCTGVFCTKCLTQALAVKKICPICTLKLTNQPIKNNIVKETIHDEEVYCIESMICRDCGDIDDLSVIAQQSSRSDCQWIGPLKFLEAHLAHDCEFVRVPCTNTGCALLIPKRRVAYHVEKECMFSSIPCTHCATLLRCRDMKDHEAKCPEARLKCAFARYGCRTVSRRKDYAQHITDCDTAHAELLARSLTLTDQKVEDLSAQLKSLIKYTAKHTSSSISVSWTVGKVAERLAANSQIESEVFELPDRDKMFLYVRAYFKASGELELRMYYDMRISYKVPPPCLGGSQVIINHPTDRSKRFTYVVSHSDRVLGFSLTMDVRPYVTANDNVTFEFALKSTHSFPIRLQTV